MNLIGSSIRHKRPTTEKACLTYLREDKAGVREREKELTGSKLNKNIPAAEGERPKDGAASRGKCHNSV